MTHDSWSVVKIKQTLYGAHRAARLGNKEHKWTFWVHVHVHMYMLKEYRDRFIIKYVPELLGGHALRFPVRQWKESISRAYLYIKHLPLPAFHFQKPSTLMIFRIYTQKHKYTLEPFHLLYAQLFPSLVCQLPALSGKLNKAAVKALASAYHNVEHLQIQNLNNS